MRNAARLGERDANHSELSAVYEQCYCSVKDTSMVGGGFPDAVIGCAGRTELVEFKTADGTLTPPQQTFTRDWRGSSVRIVRTREDVIEHVQCIRERVARG